MAAWTRPRLVGAVALVALAATVALVGVGVLTRGGGGVSPPSASPLPSSPTAPPATTLADLDTTSLTVRRTSFCSAIDAAQPGAALDAPVEARTSYDNGERVDLPDQQGADGRGDLAHEFGCSWSAAGGRAAQGWVFAPPVTTGQARELVRAARHVDGCRRVDGAAYGAPTTARACQEGGDRVQVSYRGLFGDAWLTCTLSGRAADAAGRAALVRRTDQWCAALVVAASG